MSTVFRTIARASWRVRASHPIAHTQPMRIISRPLSAWDQMPSPPRLPAEQQAEFEQLVREAQESAAAASLADAMTDAMALKRATDKARAAAEAEDELNEAALRKDNMSATAGLNGNPIEGVWRGAPPEFEGERNPRTGEVGGPKNEPLRWGASGDWSYNGRVTDF